VPRWKHLQQAIEEQALFRWILFEHGAIANPAALEQITHFNAAERNALRTMTQGERAQGLLHIIVTAIPQNYASIQLDTKSDKDQTAKACEDKGSKLPSVRALNQVVQDRLAMMQGTHSLVHYQRWYEAGILRCGLE